MKSLYICLVSLLAFAVSFPCEAGGGSNCYYVNANLNTGSKNGSDWSNAAKSLPANLIRGWKYYLANGTYPGVTLDDAESGEQFITITSATKANHGTSVGWKAIYAGQGI